MEWLVRWSPTGAHQILHIRTESSTDNSTKTATAGTQQPHNPLQKSHALRSTPVEWVW